MKNIIIFYTFFSLFFVACKSSSPQPSNGGGSIPQAVACTLTNSLNQGLSSIANVLSVSGNQPNCRVASCVSGYKIDGDAKSCIPSGSGSSNNGSSPTNFIYLPNPLTLYVDQLISVPYTPTISNCSSETPCTFSLVSGQLPSGVSLNPSTGAIFGTPSVAKTLTTYIIRATNSNGSTTQSLSLRVAYRPISGLSIFKNDIVYKVDETIENNIISYSSGAGSVTSMSISPTLPTGLTLSAIGSQQWAITGRPTILSVKTTYTITATHPDGSTASITMQLGVSSPPTSLSYTLTPECVNDNGYITCTYNFGQPINPLLATYDGQDVNFRVAVNSPTQTLPSGISLSNTGTISTTSYGPFESTEFLCGGVNAYCVYNIEAYNQLGSVFKLFKIKVNPTPPASTFNYPQTAYSFRTMTSIGNIDPQFPQGLPNCYQTSNCFEISPALPNGITFSKSTGRLTGAPSIDSKQLAKTYTVIAKDTRGNISSQPFTIEVIERIPVFKYTANSIYYAKKGIDLETTGMPRIDNSDGLDTPACGPTAIPITSFSITPALPAGLSLNSGAYACGQVFTGGTISGIPTTLSTETVYTITGCNDGGCSSVQITLDISPDTTAIVGGESHACALVQETFSSPKSIMCWGNNEHHQITNYYTGSTCSGTECFKEARYIKQNNQKLTNILSLSAGKNHNCAVIKEVDASGGDGTTSYQARGRVVCWGDNRQHQVGANLILPKVGEPTNVIRFDNDQPLQNIYAVYSGGDTTCAMGNDDFGNIGAVYCWGANYGSKAQRIGQNTPTLENASMFHSLAVGESHVCGLKLNYVYDADPEAAEYYVGSGDQVYCWGKNSHGQLGNNTSLDNNFDSQIRPVKFSNNADLSGISSLIAGKNHTCAYSITEPLLGVNNKFFYCWGDNTLGQVTGLNDGLSYNFAKNVLGINSATNPSNDIQKVGTTANSTIFLNSFGEYAWMGKWPYNGIPYNMNMTESPTQILHNYAPAISSELNPFYSGGSLMKGPSSEDFYCDTLSNNSKIYCFGVNDKGQLGNSSNNTLLPKTVILNYN